MTKHQSSAKEDEDALEPQTYLHEHPYVFHDLAFLFRDLQDPQKFCQFHQFIEFSEFGYSDEIVINVSI